MWARTTSSAPISIGSATSSSPSHAGRATSRVGGASATSSLAARPKSRTSSRTDPRKAAENLPEGLDTLTAFLGQTSQKFGRLRLPPKTGLSAELLGSVRDDVRLFSRAASEEVADAPPTLDVARPAWLGLELVAEPIDIGADDVVLANIRRAAPPALRPSAS